MCQPVALKLATNANSFCQKPAAGPQLNYFNGGEEKPEIWHPLIETVPLYKGFFTLTPSNEFRVKNSLKSVQNDFFDTLIYLKVLCNDIRTTFKTVLKAKIILIRKRQKLTGCLTPILENRTTFIFFSLLPRYFPRKIILNWTL